MTFITRLTSTRRFRHHKQGEVHPLHQSLPEINDVPNVALHLQVDPKFQTVVNTILSSADRLDASNINEGVRLDEIALFHRSELVVGGILGTGGFSDVSSVLRIVPKSSVDKELSFRQSLSRECLMNCIQTGEGSFVIKHLRKQMLDKPKHEFCMAAAELIAEGNILASLQHANIVGIRGWGLAGAKSFGDGSHDGYFLILDRIYETLSQRMARCWQPEELSDRKLWIESAHIGIQIASAIEYLHKRKLIFRDLKPDNIGFDAKGDVKIFDFGLCRRLPSIGSTEENLFSMTGRVGTMVYMSPECAQKQKYGISSDVYSFSMILFEMMNRGQRAFPGYSRDQYLELVCQSGNRPVINPGWPIMISDLLDRSWSTVVDERPTMTEIKERLQDVMMDFLNNEGTESGCQRRDIDACEIDSWRTLDRNFTAFDLHRHVDDRCVLSLHS